MTDRAYDITLIEEQIANNCRAFCGGQSSARVACSLVVPDRNDRAL